VRSNYNNHCSSHSSGHTGPCRWHAELTSVRFQSQTPSLFTPTPSNRPTEFNTAQMC